MTGGTAWSTAYLFADKPYIAALCLSVILVGCYAMKMAFNGITKQNTLIFSHLILIVCTVIPLTDYPLDTIPRSSHSYLLVYAVGGALFLRHERFYVKTVMPFLAFVFYLIYSVSDLSFTSELLHPPEYIMTKGVFINYVTAVALIFGILIIFRGDYTNEKYLTYALSKAIKTKQLSVYYQPQIDRQGKVVSAEALLRWKHPVRGFIAPDYFIPIAEASGLILPIGYWVLERVGDDMLALKNRIKDITVSVNISPIQLMDTEFPDTIDSILNKNNLSLKNIKLEITEGAFIYDKKYILNVMNELAGKGALWSLDDLGSGYSSLNILNEMPFGEVKIDKNLLKGIDYSLKNRVILEKIIEIANDVDMNIVVEGIETQTMADTVFKMGCDLQQGYLYAKPMPLDEFLLFCAQNNTQDTRYGRDVAGDYFPGLLADNNE
ncbi:EAL domain-containing protein [Phytobacter ursingii]|uniref:EAL domain-containing protein n=1 Tax=Phytobacter ursingii TaxID=1972431 RepID=A0AB35RMD3_9ENTR|nr:MULTISPECIES: EAL domain-containing protein [Enterobacteriaceae]MDV2863283.1 EAL domain-containing protein [Phytobacter ursingii]